MASKSERCDHGGKKGKRNNSGPKNQKEGLSLTKGFIYQMQYSSRGRRRNTRRNTALRATAIFAPHLLSLECRRQYVTFSSLLSFLLNFRNPRWWMTRTGQIREDPRAETCAAHDTREGGS